MIRKKQAVFMLCLGIIVCNVSTAATPTSNPPQRLSVSDMVDSSTFGGTTISEERNTYVCVSNTTYSNPVKEINTVSLEVKEEVDTPRTITTENTEDEIKEETFDSDIITAYKYKQEEEQRQEEAQKIKEEHLAKLNTVHWLEDYGINTENLSDTRIAVLAYAHQFLGIKYVWGGTTPDGFDCSGYTGYVLAHTLGIYLPRTTYDQINCSAFERIPISEAQPGDIIFNNSVSHTGFFIKDNGNSITLMHAPYTGTDLQISTYRRPNYVYRYML